MRRPKTKTSISAGDQFIVPVNHKIWRATVVAVDNRDPNAPRCWLQWHSGPNFMFAQDDSICFASWLKTFLRVPL